MSKTVWVLGAATAASAFVVAFSFVHDRASIRAMQADIAAMRAEERDAPTAVTGLAPAAMQLAPPLVATAPARQPVVAATAPTTPPAPSAESAAQTPPPLDPATIRDVLQASFVAEEVDPSWSRDARRLVDTKLRDVLGEASSIESIECRTMTCRIEIEHRDRATFLAFQQKLLTDPLARPWDGEGFLSPAPAAGPQDLPRTVAYFARKGQSLALSE